MQHLCNPPAKKSTLLRHRLVQPPLHTRLQQSLQHLVYSNRASLAVKYNATTLDSLVEPLLNDEDKIVGQNTPISAEERSFIRIPHGLENIKQLFTAHLEFEEKINHPGTGRDPPLILKGVLLEHWQQQRDGKDALRQSQSTPQTPNLLAYEFIWLSSILSHRLVMYGLEKLLPGGLDLRNVAVIRYSVDQ
jgi:hypothetical protein